MAKQPTSQASAQPGDVSSGKEAHELYETASIRHVMLEIGKLSSKVDRLIEDTNKNTTSIEDNTKKIARFETTTKAIGASIVVASVVFWWAFGDYVRIIVQDAIRLALRQH